MEEASNSEHGTVELYVKPCDKFNPTQNNSGSDSEPEADANAMSCSHSGGFFSIGGLQSIGSDKRLAHHICDKFGRSKRHPVSQHGTVELHVKPCDKFYQQYNLPVSKGSPKCSSITELVDTGAQICVAVEDFLTLTGITAGDMYTPSLKARVANNQNLKLLGVVSVILGG